MFSIARMLFIVMHLYIFLMTFSCAKTWECFKLFPVIMSSGKMICRDKRHSSYNLKVDDLRLLCRRHLTRFVCSSSATQREDPAPASPPQLAVSVSVGGCALRNAAPTRHKMFTRGCR